METEKNFDNLDNETVDKRTDSSKHYYVENCFQLSSGSFGRGFMRPDTPKQGMTKACSEFGFLPIKFKIILSPRPQILIEYDARGYEHAQTIILDTVPTKYGQKPYLFCSCGHRGKLYLRPGVYSFSCRSCLNLGFELSYVGRHTMLGPVAYYLIQHRKSQILRRKVKRDIYNGKATRKFMSLLRKTSKLQSQKAIASINKISPMFKHV